MHLESDVYYIHETLNLAKKGMGHVSPNPMVGAVIVKDNVVIARGYHKQYGAAHAELDAIQHAQQSVQGATLYCNLEPCCHTNKQTPPCAQRIIAEKIARVVICHKDPNPCVAGKGIDLLRAAGIQVTEGIQQREAEELNEVFITYIVQQRPFIHLKWAQSLDGRIATITGDSKWISNDQALAYVHRLRYKYDAIVIGENTLRIDNPYLTARVDGQVKVPWRIILASLDAICLHYNVIKDPHKTVCITTQHDYEAYYQKAQCLQDMGMHILVIESDQYGYVDIRKMVNALKKFAISSVLVEGGSMLLTSFLKERLWDRISIFIAPLFIGKGIDAVQDLLITRLDQAERIKNVFYEQFGDVMHCNVIKREYE